MTDSRRPNAGRLHASRWPGPELSGSTVRAPNRPGRSHRSRRRSRRAGRPCSRPSHGPPPPVPPAVVARDDAGRTTVRAVRLTEGLELDDVSMRRCIG